MHLGRCDAGRRTTVDRLGSSAWASRSPAWVLFAIVFLWQFPHFMSIAWMYREDYARAGYLVLPASKSETALLLGSASFPPWAFS